MISEVKDNKVITDIEPEDLAWLDTVINTSKLLAIYDKREVVDNCILYDSGDRIEVYYYKGLTDDTELTVWIEFKDNKIVGFETY